MFVMVTFPHILDVPSHTFPSKHCFGREMSLEDISVGKYAKLNDKKASYFFNNT